MNSQASSLGVGEPGTGAEVKDMARPRAPQQHRSVSRSVGDIAREGASSPARRTLPSCTRRPIIWILTMRKTTLPSPRSFKGMNHIKGFSGKVWLDGERI